MPSEESNAHYTVSALGALGALGAVSECAIAKIKCQLTELCFVFVLEILDTSF